MNGFKQWMAVLGVATMAALPLSAQTGTSSPKPTTAGESAKPATGGAQGHSAQTSKLAAADTAFVHEAAVGGMAEVEMGRMAGEKAASADVKQFGQRMVEDHGKANSELKTLAASKGVTLPTTLDAAHKAAHEKLSKLTGAAFDKAYMQQMVKDHAKDVASFKRAASTAADAELKAWAAKTLPTLQEHQKMVQSINAKLGSAGAKTEKPGGEAASR
jgi:putative membrane protein